jgi:hypothetical protein
MCSRSRRASRPRFCNSLTPFNQEGAGNAGRRLAPAVSCANCVGVCAHEHTGTAGAARHSLRDGFTAYTELSLETNSFCLHRRRIEGPANPVGSAETSAGLTPATGARTTRLCRPRRAVRLARGLRSQAKARPAKTDCAPGTPRPPLPAPNVRDDRDTPLLRARDGRVVRVIWGQREAEYFSREDWTRCRAKRKLICPSGSHTGRHIWQTSS